MTYETIRYEVTDGRAEITLDRPAVRNAFDETMVEELVGAVDAAETDESVYVVVLTGAGSAFCAGVDTSEVLEPARERSRVHTELRLRKGRLAARLLREGRKPTVAAVNGPAVGGGFSFALACDFRVMDEDAFFRDQHLHIGIPPGPMEAWVLPRLLGEARAKEFIFRRRDVDPEEARETGLVSTVADAGETMRAAREVADDLRDLPALALRETKRMLNADLTFGEVSDASIEAHWEALSDPEHHEALDAVREGRPPSFDRPY
jgi:enoyl-CoA hydratase/carnithine racemase